MVKCLDTHTHTLHTHIFFPYAGMFFQIFLHDSSHLNLSTFRYQHQLWFPQLPPSKLPPFQLVSFTTFCFIFTLLSTICIYLLTCLFSVFPCPHFLSPSPTQENVCSMMEGTFFAFFLTVTSLLGTAACTW